MKLAGKKIILAISGSIAAYKAASLCRLLIKSGAQVRVLMTPAACKFISPLTLSTLSKNSVYTDVVGEDDWNNHVDLGLWADLMLIAPATANTLAKLANGLCDNIISAVYLSARCPVFVAPAMDVDMWHHAATQKNIAQLQAYGNKIIPVGTGELASGLVGEGRMAEPEEIVNYTAQHFAQQASLKGKKILITAGPTYEAIDPVRFIGNRSSGKMGVYLAELICALGGEVILILGPSSLKPAHERLELIRVQSAQEMYAAATHHFPAVDAAIMAAAVADYRPLEAATEKIKKKGEQMQLTLVKNPDIAASLGQLKTAKQRLIGFALETQNAEQHAKDKLARKQMDFIVLNSLEDKGAGFGVDTNKVTIFSADNKSYKFELKNKKEVALDIVNTTLLPDSV